MKKMRKMICAILGVVFILGQVAPIYANGLPVQAGLVNGTKVYKAGETADFKIVIQNTSQEALENLVIVPKYSSSVFEWPFSEMDLSGHRKTVAVLEPNASVEVVYSGLTVRSDVIDGRCQISFEVSSNGMTSQVSVYPFTAATKPEPVEETPPQQAEPPQQPETYVQPETMSSGGGFSNAEVTDSSVPRVIVTGFSTEPAVVKAGEDFKLIVHLKNTSKKTRVQNMEFNFSAPVEGNETGASPAFLPKSGSNTVYLENIQANGTADVAIELNAKPDLIQKPYSIEMSVKYEDKATTQFETTSSISIPVKQDARFEFSDIELTMDMLNVGDEVNVMSNLYNMGRIKLYNVKVSFEGNSISGKEIYLGNVDPGATAVIDGIIVGEKVSAPEEKAKMIITYEDEGGQVHTKEKEFTISVSEEEEIMEEEMMMMEEEKGSTPPIILIVAGLILVVLVVIVVVIVKKRKRSAKGDGLEDELDRLIEDE